MREILFRGKRIDNGEWVEGTLYQISTDLNPFIMVENKHGCSYAVDEETVGQYTGLKDKHGKQIFEGDIVDCWSDGVNAKGTVQQRRDGLWIIYPAWQKTIMWGLCPDEYSKTTVEVIGNIHDNPELLEDAE